MDRVLQDELISYLTQTVLFDYVNISEELTILANEEFYLRTSSDQLNLIVIKSVGSYLYIDLIGGGGGSGLLGITWGSEGAFGRRMLKTLKAFCESHGESIMLVE